MQCTSCFAEIPDDSEKCPECGVSLEGEVYSAPPEPTPPLPGQDQYPGGQPEPESEAPLELGEMILRPFKDPGWFQKVLIVALMSIIPIIGPIVLMGYQVRYVRRIIFRQNSRELPGYDDFGGLIMTGLYLFLANLIYMTVILTVSGIAFLPFIGGLAALEGMSNGPGEAMCGAALAAFAIPMLIFFTIFSILLFFGPMIMVFYSRNMEFGDAFKLGDMWRLISSDLGNYIILSLSLFGIGLGAGLVAMVLFMILGFIPFVGQLAIMFLSGLLSVGLGLIGCSVFSEFYFKNKDVLGG
ncbi:MAG: DUF4013 domain-containing protein [Candidatus Eremiobacteraeota bacterium]|nr:DUF4013 domain-containing protein [Candidatus Eremiobacteraeota bacterium]